MAPGEQTMNLWQTAAARAPMTPFPERPIPAPISTIDGAPLFAEVEQTVIQLSRNDPLTSIVEPHPVRRFLNRMFSTRRPTPLAAPRLEALRRICVALRARRGNILPQEEARFFAAGYTPVHLCRLRLVIQTGLSLHANLPRPD
jgi:hypothetical protein